MKCRRLLVNILECTVIVMSVAVQNTTMKCMFKDNINVMKPHPILTWFPIFCMHAICGYDLSVTKTALLKTFIVYETRLIQNVNYMKCRNVSFSIMY